MVAKKPEELSTRWFRANKDDAEQIALMFHRGENLYERKRLQIWQAIEGRPKKEVLNLVEWLLKKRMEEKERDPDEPFDAATMLMDYRKARSA